MKIKAIIAAAGLATIGTVTPCQAVLVDINSGSNDIDSISNFTAPPALAAVWNNVGMTNFTNSGVYLGNGWALSTVHDGGMSVITLNGQSYYAVANSAQQLTNADSSGADLTLYKLQTPYPPLPALSVATSSPTVGTPYYNVGFGMLRNTAITNYGSAYAIAGNPSASYSGYGYGLTGNTASYTDETWGNNTVFDLGNGTSTATFDAGYGNVTAFAGEFLPGTDIIVYGDSGGAAFNAAGQLIGINCYLDTQLLVNPKLPLPTNAMVYGTLSWMADVATYSGEIDSITGVPEPGTFSLVVIGIFALTARNTRRSRYGKRQV